MCVLSPLRGLSQGFMDRLRVLARAAVTLAWLRPSLTCMRILPNAQHRRSLPERIGRRVTDSPRIALRHEVHRRP